MECFDTSHNQGSETVASMVVFEGGLPKKSDYRRFKIRSAEGKPDDFLSMREVTERRYGKLTEDELPDLIIIDGGKGQLSSALEIIRGAGHLNVPVVGLAKQFEYIFTEGSSDPVILRPYRGHRTEEAQGALESLRHDREDQGGDGRGAGRRRRHDASCSRSREELLPRTAEDAGGGGMRLCGPSFLWQR